MMKKTTTRVLLLFFSIYCYFSFAEKPVLFITHPQTNFDTQEITKPGVEKILQYFKKNTAPYHILYSEKSILYLKNIADLEQNLIESDHGEHAVNIGQPKELIFAGGNLGACLCESIRDAVGGVTTKDYEINITILADATYDGQLMAVSKYIMENDPEGKHILHHRNQFIKKEFKGAKPAWFEHPGRYVTKTDTNGKKHEVWEKPDLRDGLKLDANGKHIGIYRGGITGFAIGRKNGDYWNNHLKRVSSIYSKEDVVTAGSPGIIETKRFTPLLSDTLRFLGDEHAMAFLKNKLLKNYGLICNDLDNPNGSQRGRNVPSDIEVEILYKQKKYVRKTNSKRRVVIQISDTDSILSRLRSTEFKKQNHLPFQERATTR